MPEKVNEVNDTERIQIRLTTQQGKEFKYLFYD